MIQKFNGFPPGKPRVTTLPNQFFSELLPLIDDLAELKVTLYCFWALRQKEGEFRYLLRRDFANNEALMQGLAAASPPCPPSEALDAALERACARGSLLRAEVRLLDGQERLYFLNNDPGRRAILQIESGAWRPGDLNNPVEILPERPTIYALYEKNIGALTPMVGDELKDAEKDFPYEWIVEAFQIAVASNARNLRFIRAVLERRARDGRQESEQERPTIYQLYKDNIGPLTPMVDDELKDTEKNFPQEWIVEAIQIAVEKNARNLRFIRAVLERWQREGRGRDLIQNGEQDWRRYVTDEFSDLLK